MTNPDQETQAKQTYHHGNLAEALLESALNILQTSGLPDLTLRRCAADVGVSQAAISRHFADKEALLAALAAHGFRDLSTRKVARGKDLATGITNVVVNYVAFALECPDLFRLMFARQRKPEHEALQRDGKTAYASLATILQRLFEAEGLSTDDMESAAFLVWSAMHGVAMLAIDEQQRPLAQSKALHRQQARRIGEHMAAGFRAERGQVSPLEAQAAEPATRITMTGCTAQLHPGAAQA